MQEETFGPALPVAPFDTDDDAVRLANDSEFGLAASVWTAQSQARRRPRGAHQGRDRDDQRRDFGFGISEAPHGGFKQSGIGRTHGKLGLAEMVQVKYVDVDLLPRMQKVWWYGYGSDFSAQMSGFVDMLLAAAWERESKGALGATGRCGDHEHRRFIV